MGIAIDGERNAADGCLFPRFCGNTGSFDGDRLSLDDYRYELEKNVFSGHALHILGVRHIATA